MASPWPIAAAMKRRERPKSTAPESSAPLIVWSLLPAVARIISATNSPPRADSTEKQNLVRNTYDLVEFLHDVLKIREFPWATFEHKVALHTSCSAIRGLNMASMSERVHDPVFSKPKALLSGVPGIEFGEFERVDECCGFGGTFAVTEEAVSAKMGYDKLAFMQKASPDCIVSSDMSCLMHLQGCARRQKQDIPFFHLAEILNGVSL